MYNSSYFSKWKKPKILKLREPRMGFKPTSNNTRVRMILVLDYWVLGNIYRYWVVLLLGDIFSLWHPIRYQSDSSRHRPHDNHLDVFGAAVVSRWCQGERGGIRVQAIHHHHHSFEVLRGSVVYTLHQYQYIAMLQSSIGIGIGYWYR